jgi:hypothetical protein
MLVADERAAAEVREQAGYPTWEMAALVHPLSDVFHSGGQRCRAICPSPGCASRRLWVGPGTGLFTVRLSG